MKVTNTGNGVEIHPKAGGVFVAGHGETIEVTADVGAELSGLPDWIVETKKDSPKSSVVAAEKSEK